MKGEMTLCGAVTRAQHYFNPSPKTPASSCYIKDLFI